MAMTKLLFAMISMALATPEISQAVELQAETARAWDDYVRNVNLRMEERLKTRAPFLWTDESPDRSLRLRRGEIIVAPVVGHGTQDVPSGLIHDWIGAVFIPNATIESLWDVVHAYDNYKEIYKPAVTDSSALSCTPSDQEFSMIWQRRVLFVNAAMEGKYRARDFSVDTHRGYNIADSVSVQEIEGYGHAGEHRLPAGAGHGFIWRVRSVAKYEERDGGVYLELEAIALTRDIPASLRWLANRVINHLSIDSMTATLRETREAVISLSAKSQRLAICNGGAPIALRPAGAE
jgi:hypothetical protein